MFLSGSHLPAIEGKNVSSTVCGRPQGLPLKRSWTCNFHHRVATATFPPPLRLLSNNTLIATGINTAVDLTYQVHDLKLAVLGWLQASTIISTVHHGKGENPSLTHIPCHVTVVMVAPRKSLLPCQCSRKLCVCVCDRERDSKGADRDTHTERDLSLLTYRLDDSQRII